MTDKDGSNELSSMASKGLLAKSTPPCLELYMQLLGAQLCANLSQAVLSAGSQRDKQQGCGSSSLEESVAAAASAVTTPTAMDLSAHFGSHALRRGGAKPLGPAFRSSLKRDSGAHEGRAARIWQQRLMHRRWCPRCGVWLQAGITTSTVHLPADATREDEKRAVSVSGRKTRQSPTMSSTAKKEAATTARRVCARCLTAASARAVRRLRRSEKGKLVSSPVVATAATSVTPTPITLSTVVEKCRVKRSCRRLRKRGPNSHRYRAAAASTAAVQAKLIQAIPKGPLSRSSAASKTNNINASNATTTSSVEVSRSPPPPLTPASTVTKPPASVPNAKAMPPRGPLKPSAKASASKGTSAGKKKVLDVMSKLGF